MNSENELSDHDKAAVARQVDYFIEVMSQRYGLSAMEVVEAVRWVKDRRDFMNRARLGSAVSLLGLVISAMTIAFWEGVKSMLSSTR